MCDLTCTVTQPVRIGYKVVAYRIGQVRPLSAATGIEYPAVGERLRIQVPKKQERIGNYFIDTLLDKDAPSWDNCFSSTMVGRTAAFVYKKDARQLLLNMCNVDLPTGYRLAVIKVRLSEEVMAGSYGGNPVVAGKMIENMGVAFE